MGLKQPFYLLLVSITVLGSILRFVDYDRIPPFGETNDEFMYPWAGISLLKTGVPSSWSWFPSYESGQIVTYWGEDFKIVSPWTEKPPLYSLLTGTVALAAGQDEFHKVRLTTVRLVPIFLSLITIILIGLITKNLFNSQTALVAAGLYATIPTIVMANRLSLTENLLIPITLLAFLIFSSAMKGKWQSARPYLLGFCSGLALLTKNIGLYLPIVLIGILVLKREWKSAVAIGVISAIFGLIHPLIGYYYDWNLFLGVIDNYRQAHSLGLPEFIFAIFQFPVIGHKEKIFLDGSMLAGYILLLTSPFWLLKEKTSNDSLRLFLALPFTLLIFLALLEGGGITFFGWHLFPVYPFLVIILAKAIDSLWQKPEIFKLLFFYLIIGASTVRFSLLLVPEFAKSWQWILAGVLLILVSGFFLKTNYQRLILSIFFFVFLIVNVLVVINLNQIYASYPQPLE